MKLLMFISLFILSSCSLFQSKRVSKDIHAEVKKICLDSSGSGRILINGHKYIFHFESAYDDEENKWIMGLDIPLHGEEVFEVFLSKTNPKFKMSLEQSILKQVKGVKPRQISSIIKLWANTINEIYRAKAAAKNDTFRFWSSESKTLLLKLIDKKNKIKIISNFTQLDNNGFFSRYDLLAQDKLGKELFKLENIVRKCLIKP